jgi:hypothetical protein
MTFFNCGYLRSVSVLTSFFSAGLGLRLPECSSFVEPLWSPRASTPAAIVVSLRGSIFMRPRFITALSSRHQRSIQ